MDELFVDSFGVGELERPLREGEGRRQLEKRKQDISTRIMINHSRRTCSMLMTWHRSVLKRIMKKEQPLDVVNNY